MPVSPQISVRLAIAFTVLKHKPKDQSIPSYLLDLQSHFRLSDDSQATCDDDAWRNHALSLEKELESLKQKREGDEEELVRLRQNVSRDVPGEPDAAPPKKKTKKTGKAPELQLQDDDWAAKREERLNAVGQSLPSLTAAFTSLRSVLSSVGSQTGDDAAPNSRLLVAITRTIGTIGKFLDLQNISTSSVPSELNESRIAMTSPLMVYVLRVAFPALFHQGISSSSSTAVSSLIDTLFVPLVRSFTLVSRAYIMHHLDVSSAKKKSKSRNKGNEKVPKTPSQTLVSDARMDILALLGEALNALDSIVPHYSGYTAGIRERIALESIRALELLYPTVSADGSVDSSVTQDEASRGPESSQASLPHRRRTVLSRQARLEVLARKDATWYLCHILNSCASRGGAKDGLDSMLNGALLDGAAKVVKTCISMDCDGVTRAGRRCVMDVVCRNMVLAACEKIVGAPPQENPGL
ncbi:hypothetical protein DEU56DRAFT_813914 [Suillus clintonianus]|uniref:uncharacterized protein n=1 Tax=Suillus clintonianus TaxID=1904413 RepID=UPI001B880981|nr:uncharacterized protein DEU56DRAFT_813914 [Suillus clintonianus]KAG2131695.1 hypothetical protein DEU56DRAFT_813914 [Suillus clintonianus]